MRVLITYGWCRIAYVAAESLSCAGFEVYVCDSTRWSMTRVSKFVRGFDLVPDPFKEPQQYVTELSAIVKRRQIDVLLPMHEDGLVIQTYRDCLPVNLLIACPVRNDLRRGLDKYEIIQVAESAGVQVPKTAAPSSLAEVDSLAEQLGFPLIIKTRRGNSGKGVFRVNSVEEANRTYREIMEGFGLLNHQMPILQEYLPGNVYGSCFLAQEGELKACFIERYLRCKEGGFGTSVLREPCDSPLLLEYTQRMAAALNWTGIGHFDFLADTQISSAYLIEMNPRFWGALNLAVQNGYDFPRALITMLTTGTPDSKSFLPSLQPVSSLWIVGEIIASVAEFRSGKKLAPLASLGRIIFPGRHCKYDDFRWHDPLPLLMEFVYYGNSFLASGGNINPTVLEMLQ
ncbi:ATP-grasp domain-containing protein [Nostoc sp. C052]|uniref:carboxylate--amine ligase n=1 Tax=Nostoc sp. C052 TaxID=2576902 RepID=UPI0015C37A34|nr:ATP-grasp domain-containing protein [Nostoc sp. C052]QLE40898.1 ATP-grasp domain-containing protein [Nostoc sp. C052]